MYNCIPFLPSLYRNRNWILSSTRWNCKRINIETTIVYWWRYHFINTIINRIDYVCCVFICMCMIMIMCVCVRCGFFCVIPCQTKVSVSERTKKKSEMNTYIYIYIVRTYIDMQPIPLKPPFANITYHFIFFLSLTFRMKMQCYCLLSYHCGLHEIKQVSELATKWEWNDERKQDIALASGRTKNQHLCELTLVRWWYKKKETKRKDSHTNTNLRRKHYKMEWNKMKRSNDGQRAYHSHLSTSIVDVIVVFIAVVVASITVFVTSKWNGKS